MEEQEALALLSKKRGREGSIESQQKFDFFSYDCTHARLMLISSLKYSFLSDLI